MTTEIIIAIVTAVVSLLVAIVSLINSIISNRQNATYTKNLETLKFELSQKQDTAKLSDDYLLKQVTSLDTIVKEIQRMKDMIQLVLNSQGQDIDTESTLESIKKNRLDIFNCYEEQLSNLAKEDISSAHKAKNIALAVETQLKNYLAKTAYASEMSKKQKQHIFDLRNELSDAQDLLRDSKMNKLIQRLGAK